MKSIRYEQHRAQLNLPEMLPKELTIKLAASAEDYIKGFKIIYDCYIEKGYAESNVHSMRATPYHLLPHTTMILAYWNDEVIGTVSLIRDNPLGLPIESIFNLERFRKEQKSFCEVSSMAIKKEFRGQKGEIFFPLIRYAWTYTLEYFGIDMCVIAVNPTMQELYESILYFEPLEFNNTVDNYDFANNNPAVGEYIDIKNSYKFLDEKYKNLPFNKNISLFLQQKDIPNYQFPIRKYNSHLDSPALPSWIELFKKILPQLRNDQLRKNIANAFGFKNEEEMSLASNQNRNRIPVTFKIINFPESKVVDISMNGLKLISNEDFDLLNPTLLRIQVSNDTSLSIVAKLVWKNNKNNYGFQIIEQSKKWNELVLEIYSMTYSHLEKTG